MDHSFFIHNYGEGETSILSHCREEDGKGFLIASHPPFSLSPKPYGNYDRGFPTLLPLDYFSSTCCGSFTLSNYIISYWDGCSRFCISQSPHKAASPILPLTYKTVCHKLFKGLKNVVSVLTSNIQSLYVMLCYVIMIMIIYLSIYLGVLVFKSYGIQESMLCCRQNIARHNHTTG